MALLPRFKVVVGPAWIEARRVGASGVVGSSPEIEFDPATSRLVRVGGRVIAGAASASRVERCNGFSGGDNVMGDRRCAVIALGHLVMEARRRTGAGWQRWLNVKPDLVLSVAGRPASEAERRWLTEVGLEAGARVVEVE